MINILGKQVVLMLVALVLVNGALGYGLYEYIVPSREVKESELKGIQGEIESRRAEVAKLKEEFILLQLQLREFKELEAQGFFNNQNRVKAQESFDKLGQIAGILKTRYDIKSGELVEEPLATAANYVVVHSPVTLEFDSLDDVDVYTFIKGLQEKFPGSVDLTSVKLERKEVLTAPVLRKIGSGTPTKLVEAKLDFSWRTMSNRDKLEETDRESRTNKRSLTDPPEPEVVPEPIPLDVPSEPVPAAPQPAGVQ